jgi:hypothetical protein
MGRKIFTLCRGKYLHPFFERFSISLFRYEYLKGLSHEIFGPVYWPVWMHLGLNKNHFWFLNFKGAPSIGVSFYAFQFKPSRRFLESPRRIGNWGLSCQPFSENWGLGCQSFSENWGLCCQSFSEILRFSEKYFHPKQRFSKNRKPKIYENWRTPQTQLPIILWDSKNLGECLAWNASKLKTSI